MTYKKTSGRLYIDLDKYVTLDEWSKMLKRLEKEKEIEGLVIISDYGFVDPEKEVKRLEAIAETKISKAQLTEKKEKINQRLEMNRPFHYKSRVNAMSRLYSALKNVFIENSAILKTVSVMGLWISSTEATFFAEHLKVLEELTILNLSRSSLNDACLTTILSSIKTCTKLAKLELNACKFTHAAIAPLCEFLRARSIIVKSDDWKTHLRLPDINGAHSVGHLPRLNLNHNKLNDDFLRLLLSGLTEDSGIIELDVRNNLLTDKVLVICDAILTERTEMGWIDLRGNKILNIKIEALHTKCYKNLPETPDDLLAKSFVKFNSSKTTHFYGGKSSSLTAINAITRRNSKPETPIYKNNIIKNLQAYNQAFSDTSEMKKIAEENSVSFGQGTQKEHDWKSLALPQDIGIQKKIVLKEANQTKVRMQSVALQVDILPIEKLKKRKKVLKTTSKTTMTKEGITTSTALIEQETQIEDEIDEFHDTNFDFVVDLLEKSVQGLSSLLDSLEGRAIMG